MAAAVVVGERRVLTVCGAHRRTEVRLVLAPLQRSVDVSAHPAAARTAIEDAAATEGCTFSHAWARTREVLDAEAGAAGAWVAPSDADPAVTLGGASFPLLAEAYRSGAPALDEVPRWAAPVLAAPTARQAAELAWPGAATRPVVTALARRFSQPGEPGAPVPLVHLAVGTIGARALGPDRLARVLATDGHPHPPDAAPERREIDASCRTVAGWGATRTERLLVDALHLPNGPRLLLELLRFARDLGDHGPRRMANRLQDAHDQHRALVATDAGPRPPRRPARQAAQARHPARPRDPRHAIYAAPAAPGTVTPTTPLATRPEVTALHRATVGALTFVVPRTVGDLQRWSRLLANCLHDYGPAAAAGRSTIIGIERDGALRYALEVDQHRCIRQLVGPANRPADPADRLRIARRLAATGIIDASAPQNAVWLGR